MLHRAIFCKSIPGEARNIAGGSSVHQVCAQAAVD